MIHGFIEENINKNLQISIKKLLPSTSKKAVQQHFCFIFVDPLTKSWWILILFAEYIHLQINVIAILQ